MPSGKDSSGFGASFGFRHGPINGLPVGPVFLLYFLGGSHSFYTILFLPLPNILKLPLQQNSGSHKESYDFCQAPTRARPYIG